MPLRDEDYLTLSTSPFGQGARMERGIDPQRRRWLPAAQPGDRQRGRDRGGAAPALRRHDARQDQLDLMLPQRFYVASAGSSGDRHVYASRTRFIPARLLKHFEERARPPPEVPGLDEWKRQNADLASPRIDLAARMRAMWK